MSLYCIPTISDDISQTYHGINLFSAMTQVRISWSYELEPYLQEVAKNLSLNKETLKDHPTARALRDFYWRMGIDPTKTRPSSEALVRRFLSSNTIPKINSVVDAGNIASMETLVPIGIYDADKITGDMTLKFAGKGEEFIDISNKKQLLEGKEIVLSDGNGIIHIFPYRDAFRTRICDDTKRILIVGCGVPRIDPNLTRVTVERALELIKMLGA